MKIKLLLLMALTILTGCKSEIDKCVDAAMKYGTNTPSKEYGARLACLRAQGGG
jgi:hypothetical protein